MENSVDGEPCLIDIDLPPPYVGDHLAVVSGDGINVIHEFLQGAI
jgi:hypothetical protein